MRRPGTDANAEDGPGLPCWGELRQQVAEAVACCREGGAPASLTAALAELCAQVTQVAWREDISAQREARAYDRGFADGVAARHAGGPRRGGPRPDWPRAVS